VRRLSYPKPAPPSQHAVMVAQYSTQAKLDEGILYEAGGWTFMAGTCDGGWFVMTDDGHVTREHIFDSEHRAATCLMNVVAYTREDA
jgi:hypothetical protein